MVERIAETLDDLTTNDELYFLGSSLLNTATTMVTEQPTDIDELERLVSHAKAPHSYGGALVHEELARQYLISPVHTLEQFSVVLEAGMQYCRRSPALRSHILRLESLAARAISTKLGEPLVAADQMRLVTRQLRLPQHFNPSILAETLGLEASMRLSAGQRTPASIELLNEAYGWAHYMESPYAMGWIEREAKRFDIVLDPAH